jgi:hypothetical protein
LVNWQISNQTKAENILNMLEASTKDISNATNPRNVEENKNVAQQGGNVAKVARKELEFKTGQKVFSSSNAKMELKYFFLLIIVFVVKDKSFFTAFHNENLSVNLPDESVQKSRFLYLGVQVKFLRNFNHCSTF